MKLPAEIIHVKVSKDYVSSWIPEGKDGHSRWESTSTSYDAPLTQSGVAKILTNEEQAYIEEVLAPEKPKGWLNPNRISDNAWMGINRFKVAIPFPEGLTLHTDNEIDFVKWKILLANNRDIAKDYEASKGAAFLYYLEKESDANKASADKMSMSLRMHEKFSEVSKTFKSIYKFFAVAHKGNVIKLPAEEGLEEAKIKLYEYASTNVALFLDILEDADYQYKAIYYVGMIKGAFSKKDYEIRASYINGALIGKTTQDVVQYIKNIEEMEDQAEYAKLINRIKS